MPELTEITETPAKIEETEARIEDDDDDSDDTIPELEDTGKLDALPPRPKISIIHDEQEKLISLPPLSLSPPHVRIL